jgi:hypothetical protein
MVRGVHAPRGNAPVYAGPAAGLNCDRTGGVSGELVPQAIENDGLRRLASKP